MNAIDVLWSGEVQGRGQMRYVEWRGCNWWQVQTAKGWCTSWGEAGYFAAEVA